MTRPDLEDKYEHLQRILRELNNVAVAFSAGVDSTLLLKVAIDTLGPDNVLAVTGRSASRAQGECHEAAKLARTLGAEHVMLDTDELDDPAFVRNPANRCFLCKDNLYGHIERMLAKREVGAVVCGTNVDDFDDYRPGMLADRRHNIRAPLAEAGFTKSNLRELSKKLGLPTHDKPANPCLVSRIPYGESITPDKLRMIEAAESFLHDLGNRECRVRHHGDLARIEVPAESIPTMAQPENARRICERFRAIGFTYVSLDLRGFRSGSLNESLPHER